MSATTNNQHGAADILRAILNAIQDRLIPITRDSFAKGGDPFGGAILDGANLEAVAVSVNASEECPVYHGELNCIRHFYTLPPEDRPEPKACIFFATHEPCALCLSAFAWTGFPIIYHLFTYEETDELLGMSDDIEIVREIFRVRAPSDTDDSLTARPLYNKENKFFSVRSIDGLVQQVSDEKEREEFKRRFWEVRATYDEFRPRRV
ncbi:hypothetical protein N656DRAFT_776750 [Canariomyces notabilis]|uniref:CMP/dCMP-type deaminase domain-containing protein n=1 Tax=Canariomyces notabilis TaxID=2074819 RepID=A0AAN6THJ1_9PEZI|nr:hypothetical protein N656DRAFT_776750 [Canariomyces arenarius]